MSRSAIMELSIVLLILGLLGIIGIYSYISYTRKVYFAGIMTAASQYKEAVENCAQKKGKLTGCNAGTNSIPRGIEKPKDSIALLNVKDGIITATPVPNRQISSQDIYVLSPTYSPANGVVTWRETGAGMEHGYGR